MTVEEELTREANELRAKIAALTAPGEYDDLQRRALDYANEKDMKRGGEAGTGTKLLREQYAAIEQLQARVEYMEGSLSMAVKRDLESESAGWRKRAEQAKAKLAEYKEDAERYQHMRASAEFQDRNGPGLYWYLPRWNRELPLGERLDAAIDAARRKEGA